MPRHLTVAAAQLGPIARADTRAQVVERLIAHLREAQRMGADLVVFPELALTTFFPRWYFEDQAQIDAFFETEMPGPAMRPLFDEARRLDLGFCLGYAELARESGTIKRYNASVLVDKSGSIAGKYRKVHLPGHDSHEPWRRFQHLEKRYFDVGNYGFRVFDAFGAKIGLLICNDRRWPEAYRALALQGAEIVLLGYNTPVHNPPAPDHDDLALFHNTLVMQSGAYQNALWVVGVAKGGTEEGVPSIAGSQIVAPSGVTVAACRSDGDELAIARCDLDAGASYKRSTFDFARHRQPWAYELVTARKGPGEPVTRVYDPPKA